MAGTGGTTSYSPISLLTGTTLLPPKPATPTTVKPTVVVSQPTQGGGLTTTAPKPVVISQPTQGGGLSGSASTTTKKTTTPTLSEMMGSSGTASSSSAKKPATNTLSQMMGSSGTAKAATTTKAPTADQKKAINSLAGLDAAAAKMPGQSKAAIANQFMQALSAAAKEGKAVPNPAGLTAEEADKYRSQFYTQFYSGQPVQQIVDNTAIPTTNNFNAMFPAIRPSGPQAPLPDLSSPLYQVGQFSGAGVTPALGNMGDGEFGVMSGINVPYMGEDFPGTGMTSSFGMYPQRFDVGAPDTRALGAAMSPRQIAQPVAPYGRGIDAIGMPQIDYGNPAAVPYGRGVIPGPMPQMDYVAPGNQQITFTPQAVRPGVPSGMPAAPFIPQAVRPGVPAGLPAAPERQYGMLGSENPAVPTEMLRDRFPTVPGDQLNARGVANRILDYILPQRATSETTAQGGETGGVYDLTKIPPTPYPRPITSGETIMPLADLYDAMNKSINPLERFGAGVAGIKIPGSQEELNALIQQNMGNLGTYDPATGRMVIPNATSKEAQAALAALKADDKMWSILGPYVDQATYTRTPVATDRPVPVDMTRPVPATVPMRPAAPAPAPAPTPPPYVSGPGATAPNAQYAAQQRAGLDALLAGGQAAAAVPTPANRQGQYGALDDLLSGRAIQQWITESQANIEAQRAKRLAEGVDPNNLYDNMLWSAGLYRPQPGAPSEAPAPSPASTVLPPDNSLRQPQAVTQDVLAGLGVRPADQFVQQYGNIPAILGAKNPDGSQRVFAGGRTEEPLGTLSASGAFTSGKAPVKKATVAEAPAGTPDVVSPGPESAPDVVSSGPEGRLTAVDPETGRVYSEPRAPGQYDLGYVKNSAGVRGVQYMPQAGQIVAPSGYIYEKNAEGGYDRVGKVPGYTDAELYKAANKGAFRDPNNIVVGGTEVAPNGGVRQSGLVKWAREQKAKYEAEVAKKTAEAEAKGETYNPVPFTDYLSAAASVATGSIPGMIASAVKLGGPAVIDWLASQPLSQKSKSSYDPYDYAGSAEKSSGSGSSSKSKNKGKDKDDTDDTGGTDGTGGTGGTTLPPPGSAGYQFAALFPEYANVVFPPNTYRPGIDPEWDYFRKFADGGFINQPRMVVGPGGPKDDKIPARIDGREEARLSNGEFVITADAVRGIGGGDPQRGAMELMKLNEMFSGKPNGSKLNVEKVR